MERLHLKKILHFYSMEKLNFPKCKVLIKNKENKPYIFDRIRKKWLYCSPEEWVRVHCVDYITKTKGYPASWILIEKEIKNPLGTEGRLVQAWAKLITEMWKNSNQVVRPDLFKRILG
jgi:hypothetical protein